MEHEKKHDSQEKHEKKHEGVEHSEKVEKDVEKGVEEKSEKKCKIKACLRGVCECGMKKRVISVAVVLILLLAVAGSFVYKKYKTVDIGVEGVRTKVEQFIKENTQGGGAGIEIKEIVKEGGLYKVTIDANKQIIPAYVTLDGTKFFPQAVSLTDDKKDLAAQDESAAPQKTEAENKTDVPTVDLFVMSYCPYGLQMEKGLLPAVEALGNKIKFNLKFVDYTLHGQKEVAENLNQYCIQKTQPAKLNKYLACIWKDSKGTAESCMKNLGINAAQVLTCVSDAKKEFSTTEKEFNIDAEENVKFGVQGSPTLVVNGTTISSSRDSASVLKAICSGFKDQPKECSSKLSSAAPSAGFDDQAAAAKAGSAAPASCATPQ